jgi:alpha-tubulin suppressor-like RCC1 family protein
MGCGLAKPGGIPLGNGTVVLIVDSSVTPTPTSTPVPPPATPTPSGLTTPTPPASPTPAPTGKIVAGGGHSCALMPGGAVKCWGWGSSGQIGNGSKSNQLSPVSVVSLGQSVTAISAGLAHTCALLQDGSIKCWGMGGNGELGNGSVSNPSSPVAVAPLGQGAIAVSAGTAHTCALLVDGSVSCWGNGGGGALGNGSLSNQLSPVAVTPLGQAASAISAGDYHTCALLLDGTIKCWGNGSSGQLGIGTTPIRSAPATVLGLGQAAVAVSAGVAHTCALLQDGSVKCWGQGANGRLGNGSTSNSASPVSVASFGQAAVALAGGGTHTCALLQDGSVKCWGAGTSGQLGNGATVDQTLPVSVLGLGAPAAAISAAIGYNGGSHTCAWLQSGSIKCWGSGVYGQLGNGQSSDQLTPVEVIGLP